MFLLDTVVLSELRKPPRQRNRNLVQWIREVPSQDLFISVLTVGEIERGIEGGESGEACGLGGIPAPRARHGTQVAAKSRTAHFGLDHDHDQRADQ